MVGLSLNRDAEGRRALLMKIRHGDLSLRDLVNLIVYFEKDLAVIDDPITRGLLGYDPEMAAYIDLAKSELRQLYAEIDIKDRKSCN